MCVYMYVTEYLCVGECIYGYLCIYIYSCYDAVTNWWSLVALSNEKYISTYSNKKTTTTLLTAVLIATIIHTSSLIKYDKQWLSFKPNCFN